MPRIVICCKQEKQRVRPAPLAHRAEGRRASRQRNAGCSPVKTALEHCSLMFRCAGRVVLVGGSGALEVAAGRCQ